MQKCGISDDDSIIQFCLGDDDIEQFLSCFQEGNKREALIELRNTLMTCDISPFEVHHSGFVKALLDYLTIKSHDRDDRIRLFLNVYSSCPVRENSSLY